MKRFLPITLLFFLLMSHASAQVFLFENFEGGIPADWTRVDGDGLVPNHAYMTDAWVAVADSSGLDSCAASSSWYIPPGVADDWLISPMIVLETADNFEISWQARAVDPSFRDGYELKISTTGADTADFSALPVLFSKAEENPYWTSRILDLDSAGLGALDTFWFAFHNPSDDNNLLYLDNVKVYAVPDTDARLVNVSRISRYRTVPFLQTQPLILDFEIENGGLDTLTGVRGIVDIFQNGSLVYTDSSAIMDTVPPATLIPVSFPGFTPLDTGHYRVDFAVILNELDQFPVNNMWQDSLYVSDTLYARDNFDFGVEDTLSFSLGDGNSGLMGNVYGISWPDKVTSVAFSLTGAQVAGQQIWAEIWEVVDDVPALHLGTSDTAVIVGLGTPEAFQLDFAGYGVTVEVGKSYFVGIAQADSNISLAASRDIFTPQTAFQFRGGAWVSHDQDLISSTDPVWQSTYQVRPVLASECRPLILEMVEEAAQCDSADGLATVTLANGMAPFAYLWDDSLAQTADTAVGLMAGVYWVTVTDSLGCMDSAQVTVTNLGAPNIDAGFATDPYCLDGADGTAWLEVSGGTLPYAYLWEDGQLTDTAVGLSAGTIGVTVTDVIGCQSITSVEVGDGEWVFATLDSTGEATCDSCLDGYASLSVSGGVLPYSFVYVNASGDTVGTGNPTASLPAGNLVLYVSDVNGCMDTLDLSITVGRESFISMPDLRLYPNPSSGIIQVEFSAPLKSTWEWKIIDLMGHIVRKGKENPPALVREVLDLSDLSAGHYWIKITFDGFSTQKIIKMLH